MDSPFVLLNLFRESLAGERADSDHDEKNDEDQRHAGAGIHLPFKRPPPVPCAAATAKLWTVRSRLTPRQGYYPAFPRGIEELLSHCTEEPLVKAEAMILF